ncbi:Putative nuclease HARBI1, partial [Dufourea novaeangliae]
FIRLIRPEDPRSFTNYVRMEESDLNDLLLLIAPLIQKKDTIMREAISPRDRLSVTLRYLATGNTFQDLSFSTRIAPNTVSQIVDTTIQAIIEILEHKVMVFPSIPEHWKLIANKFQLTWQFSHCIGSIDSKHIVFRPPRKEGSYFRNYKGIKSIALFALVDADYKFIFTDIGRNGRMHDSSVLRESVLGAKLFTNSLNLPPPSMIAGFYYDMPYVIIGDDAFPLKENLMKPYPDRGIFNYRLSRARRTAENAFGILANRFRVLLNPIPLSVQKVEAITYACVLLHNYLLSRNCEWYIPSQCRGINPDVLDSGLPAVGPYRRSNRTTRAANTLRDNFTEYFNTAGIVPWQYDAISRGNY